MLSQFRSLAKTPIAKVLFGVLAVSFVGWGVRDMLRSGGVSDAVIKAGPRTISSTRFRQMVQEELKQYNQQSGQNLSLQDAAARGVDRQAADAIAADEALAAYIQKIGLHPSDKQVLAEISKAPRFFNAVTGQFDKDAYRQFVQNLGLSEQEFENILRDQLAQTQFVSGMATGLRAPLAFAALQAAYEGEGRTFSYFILPPDAVAAPAQPTDAQLNGFLKDNAAQLMRPEARGFTVAAFSAAKLASSMPADPAQVQKVFAFEKDTLSKPEKRSLTVVPVRDAAQAQAVAAQLQKGADPLAVAKSLGVKPLVYSDAPKTAVPDKKVADVAFAMSPGEVKGPVQGDFSLAVVKLTGVTPGHEATLDEVRPKIEQEVKQAAAIAAVNKAVQKYEDGRSSGSSLADAAKAAGATVTPLPPVVAQGITLQRQQVNIPPQLLQAGFALQPGKDTDVIQLAPGEYAALHLDKVVPPSPPPLDEIRPQLTKIMMQQDLMKRLQAKADGIAAAVSKGQPLQAAAAANHVQVQQAVAVTRSAAGKTFDSDLLSRLFLAKPGDVLAGRDVKPGVVVAKLEAAVPATAQTTAQAAADERDAVAQGLVQDFAAEVRNGARDAIKPKVDYKKARQALGGDQDAGAQ